MPLATPPLAGIPPVAGPNYDGMPVFPLGPNLMSLAGSDFEDGTLGGWGANSLAPTMANSTAQAFSGTHCLSMTSSQAGSMNCLAQGLSAAVSAPVTPGQVYTVAGYVRSAAISRTTFFSLNWLNQAGSYFGSSNASSTPVTTTTTGWTFCVFSSVSAATGSQNSIAPIAGVSGWAQTAYFCSVGWQVNTVVGAGEVHYLDYVFLGPGLWYPT